MHLKLQFLLQAAIVLISLPQARGACNPLPDQIGFGIFDVDIKLWKIGLVWTEQPKCRSVNMKLSHINDASALQLVDTQICDPAEIFCYFKPQKLNCPIMQKFMYIQFYSSNPCYKRVCPFSTNIVQLETLIAKKPNICDKVFKNGKQVTVTDREFLECGQTMTCDGPVGEPGPGCYCKSGYEDENGNCLDVSTQECPSEKEFNPCGREIKNCIDGEVTVRRVTSPGCFCKSGYEGEDGKCVVSTCPNDKYEFKPCGGEKKVCFNGEETTTNEESGCFCKSGFESQDGSCIDEQTCAADEIFKPCGGERQTCLNGDLTTETSFTAGCFCLSGIQSAEGNCIDKTQECPSAFQEYKPCGGSKKVCENGVETTESSFEAGCFCKSGIQFPNATCISSTLDCPSTFHVYKPCGGDRSICIEGEQVEKTDNTPGCFCETGIQTEDNVCVEPTSTCPSPEYEYKPCGGSRTVCTEGSLVENTDFTHGCFCKSGIQIPNGDCIEGSLECPAGKTYKPCGGLLEFCNSKTGENEEREDFTPGCHCDSGYVDENENCFSVAGSCNGDEDKVFKRCGQLRVCFLNNFTRHISDTFEPGCYCKDDLWLTETGVCTDICPEKPPKQPLEVVAISECGSDVVSVTFTADPQRSYSYSLWDKNVLVREDVADSSGTLVFRKDALGVGLYTIKIIDNSAEHEESASFAVTYESRTTFDSGVGELIVNAFPWSEGSTILFAANANVTYRCSQSEGPLFNCESPHDITKGTPSTKGEFSILALKDGVLEAQDNFPIRV